MDREAEAIYRLEEQQIENKALQARVRELENFLQRFADCAEYIDEEKLPLTDDCALWAPHTNTGEKLPRITIGDMREARRLLEGK